MSQRSAPLVILLFTLFAAPAALPCSGTPPSLGEVNLSRDTMVPSAPLWIVVTSTFQESYPFVILNQTSNQPILYTIIKKHTNPGAFPNTYYKLEPHVGIWGEVGDVITVGVDENAPNSWLVMPAELPEIELDESLDMEETIALPGMWPDESISITVVEPNSCYPQGAWRINVPFQVYEETVLWGILETYTDNQEGPVFMRSVFGHHLAAADGYHYLFTMTEDPGRCIRIIPSNVNGTQFEGLEYCLPQEEVVDAGMSSVDAGTHSIPLDGGAVEAMDAGITTDTDGGALEENTTLDSGASDGTDTTEPVMNDGGVDNGADGASPGDEGCGCQQTKSPSPFMLSIMLFFLIRRRRA